MAAAWSATRHRSTLQSEIRTGNRNDAHGIRQASGSVRRAFILRAGRALVITPSRMVREQIAEEFRMLRVLKIVGAVDSELQTPSVHAIESRMVADADWQALSLHDVIIGTPNSISPGIPGIAKMPQGFFDLVLIDEAHHSAAESWKALLDGLSRLSLLTILSRGIVLTSGANQRCANLEFALAEAFV